jgi:hypothetical protein
MHWLDRCLPWNWPAPYRWGPGVDNDWPPVDGPSQGNYPALRKRLQAKSPRRWRRLTRDFRYFQRVMERAGRNPEDVRFLLP